jgi:hypothetical protein
MKQTHLNIFYPTIHPEREISLEEAQVLYKLCSGVNYCMADEMTRL